MLQNRGFPVQDFTVQAVQYGQHGIDPGFELREIGVPAARFKRNQLLSQSVLA